MARTGTPFIAERVLQYELCSAPHCSYTQCITQSWINHCTKAVFGPGHHNRIVTSAQGLQGWRPPSVESARALQSAAGKELDFGTDKVPVSAALLPAAETLSAQLVRPWTASHPGLSGLLMHRLWCSDSSCSSHEKHDSLQTADCQLMHDQRTHLRARYGRLLHRALHPQLN